MTTHVSRSRIFRIRQHTQTGCFNLSPPDLLSTTSISEGKYTKSFNCQRLYVHWKNFRRARTKWQNIINSKSNPESKQTLAVTRKTLPAKYHEIIWGTGGRAPLIFNFGIRLIGVTVPIHRRVLSLRKVTSQPFYYEAGWARQSVCKLRRGKSVAPARNWIRPLGILSRNYALYQLRYSDSNRYTLRFKTVCFQYKSKLVEHYFGYIVLIFRISLFRILSTIITGSP